MGQWSHGEVSWEGTTRTGTKTMNHLTLQNAAEALTTATKRPHLCISCQPQAIPEMVSLQQKGIIDADTLRALSGPGQALIGYGTVVEAGLSFTSMENVLRDVPGVVLHLALPIGSVPLRRLDTREEVVIDLRTAA